MIVIEHFRVQSVSTSEEFSITYCININQYQCWVPQVWGHVYRCTCIRILGSSTAEWEVRLIIMSYTTLVYLYVPCL